MRKSYKPFLLLLEVSIAIGIPVLIGVLYIDIEFQEMRAMNVEANYEECISKAGKFAPFPIISEKAQGLRYECLMGYAKKLAAEGKLKEAIAVATKIPQNSPLYPEVQKRIQEWKEI